MKINCFCGNDFDFYVHVFPETTDKDYIRRPCPNCKRSYEMRVTLVKENEKFWTV